MSLPGGLPHGSIATKEGDDEQSRLVEGLGKACRGDDRRLDFYDRGGQARMHSYIMFCLDFNDPCGGVGRRGVELSLSGWWVGASDQW